MPHGGFGNLIALPFQKNPRQQGNSLFIDDTLTPYRDPFAFLSSLKPMSHDQVASLVELGQREGHVLGVRMAVTEEEEDTPWTLLPSRTAAPLRLTGPIPTHATAVIGNQLYIEKAGLPPALLNRLIRIAAFQNPEFYKAQAMRLPTFGKPRIIACAEDFPKHLALPRGCFDEVAELFADVNIPLQLTDERVTGTPLTVTRQLLLSEHRGPHAPGVAWFKRDCDMQVTKAPLPARDFVQTRAYLDWMLNLDREVTYLMGHTRWPSRGSVLNPANNHPIFLPVAPANHPDWGTGVGRLALTHNGTLIAVTRHFARLGLPRTMQVDSELLARIPAHTSPSTPGSSAWRWTASAGYPRPFARPQAACSPCGRRPMSTVPAMGISALWPVPRLNREMRRGK
jgi:hypothetical protein